MKLIPLSNNFDNLHCQEIGNNTYQVYIFAGPLGNFVHAVGEGFVLASELATRLDVRFVLNQDISYNNTNDVTTDILNILRMSHATGYPDPNIQHSITDSFTQLRSKVSTTYGNIVNWFVVNSEVTNNIAIGLKSAKDGWVVAPIYQIGRLFLQNVSEVEAFIVANYANIFDGSSEKLIIQSNKYIVGNDDMLFNNAKLVNIDNLVEYLDVNHIKDLNDMFSIVGSTEDSKIKLNCLIDNIYESQLKNGLTDSQRFIDPDVINNYIQFTDFKVTNYSRAERSKKVNWDPRNNEVSFDPSTENWVNVTITTTPTICSITPNQHAYDMQTGVVVGNKVIVKAMINSGALEGKYLSTYDLLTLLSKVGEEDIATHNWLLFNN